MKNEKLILENLQMILSILHNGEPTMRELNTLIPYELKRIQHALSQLNTDQTQEGKG